MRLNSSSYREKGNILSTMQMVAIIITIIIIIIIINHFQWVISAGNSVPTSLTKIG